MLVSLNWLKEYVDISALTDAELAERITRSGIEVDAVIDSSYNMSNVVIGHVVSKDKHPEADKLSICQVNVGADELQQIICGAPNVDAGQNVIVALPGAVLPGGMKIKKAKLRGEVSNGMICSLQELGVEGKLVPKAYAEGIYVIASDVVPGTDALDYLHYRDTILELDLTPNRSDALSMLGVAYEVAAILNTTVTLPNTAITPVAAKASDKLSLRVEDTQANPMYVAKIVQNVQVQPSPLWLQQRLMAAGVRPLNNVVDITNFVLMEYGQPLHAFDYDRLQTGEIVVRKATAGEKIVTLDTQERTLQATDLVITNGKEPVAIAGVMGGANSEVTDATTTVVIEAAYFEGQGVRQTSRRLGLRSDSSARFEKGVDPNRVQKAADRAVSLLVELAGGEVLAGDVVFDELNKEEKQIIVSPDFVNARLGMKISMDEMKEILERLQFGVIAENGKLTVAVPTRRQDIVIAEDIVEEIARLYGYDQIPMTLPQGATQIGKLTPYQADRRVVRDVMEGAGLYQAMTYSLTSSVAAQKYALKKEDVTKLMMPMSEERSTLRQSLIPSLVESVAYNVARNNSSVALYEVGSVFLGQNEHGQPYEEEHVAAVITGKWLDHAWQGESKQVDFFVLKGVVEALMTKLGLQTRISFVKADVDGLHPGRTAHILLDDEMVGLIGGLHPATQKEAGVKDTYVMELNLFALLAAANDKLLLSYTAVPRFPGMSRDIALVMNKDTAAGEVVAAIKQANVKLLQNITVFDVYEGDKMAEGKKSVAFSLTYLDPEHTLKDEEVVAAHNKVLKAIATIEGTEVR